MIKRMGVLAFIFSAWISMVIPGILIAQEVPSPPCAGCGGVPTTPKPFMVIPPSPLVSPTIPNALEYDGTNLWLTGKNGTRGSVFSGNAPSEFNNTVTFGSSGILDFNTGSVINFADGSVWKSTGLIFGSGTSVSFPDGSAWDASGLTNAKINTPTISSPTISNATLSNPVLTGTITGPFFQGNNLLAITTTNTLQGVCIGTTTPPSGMSCNYQIPGNVSVLHIRLVGDGAGGGGKNTNSGGGLGGGGSSSGGILWNLPVTSGEFLYVYVGGGGGAGTLGTSPTNGTYSAGTFLGNFAPTLQTSPPNVFISASGNCSSYPSNAWFLASGANGICASSGSTISQFSGVAVGGNAGVTSGSTGIVNAGLSLYSNMTASFSSYYNSPTGSFTVYPNNTPPGNGMAFQGVQGNMSYSGTSLAPNGNGGTNPVGMCVTTGEHGYSDPTPSFSGYGCGGQTSNKGKQGIIMIQY